MSEQPLPEPVLQMRVQELGRTPCTCGCGGTQPNYSISVSSAIEGLTPHDVARAIAAAHIGLAEIVDGILDLTDPRIHQSFMKLIQASIDSRKQSIKRKILYEGDSADKMNAVFFPPAPPPAGGPPRV